MVCEVYEDALLQDPVNEELLSSLFMSYVRVCDYKKQQQTALALHKVKPNNPYYFWAIMSIVMQVNFKLIKILTRNIMSTKKLIGFFFLVGKYEGFIITINLVLIHIIS